MKLHRCLRFLLALALLGFSTSGCTKEMSKSRHLSRAKTAFEAQKYDEAEIEYLKVRQVAPQNPEAIRQLGLIYYDQGRLLQAYSFLHKASELDPADPEVHLKLGLIYFAFGEVGAAAAEANLVLAKQPGHSEALELLAGCAFTPKDVEEMQQKIDKMRQADQDRAGYHIASGTLMLRRQDNTNAEIEFKKALDLDPKSTSALAALAGIYWGRNDVAAADKVLKSAADLSPIRSIRRVKYAEFKARTGKIEEAKHDLKEITRQAPDYLPAWKLQAQLAFDEKKYDECKSLLERVLARESYDYEASILSGNVSLIQGDATNAVTTFSRLSSVPIYSNAPQFQFQLGRAYALAGDTTKAITSLTKAVSANTNFVEAILLLAELNIRKGDVSPAIASLTKFIEKQPQIPQAHLLLVNAYLAKKDPDQALAVCQRMSQIFPKAPDVQLLIGSLLVKQKKRAEARQAFEKVLELSPGHSEAIDQLVRLDIQDQQYDAAIARVQKQIDKDPKSAAPLLLLSEIHTARADGYTQAENKKNESTSRPILQMVDVPAAQTELNQAETALRKAIDLEPGLQTPHKMLAAVYSASGKPQQALEQLNGVLAKTNDFDALMGVASIQEKQTNYVAAKEAYEKIITYYPNNVAALNNLACLCYDHFDQLDKASQLAEQARRLAPENPSIADTLGWILYKRGEYARALTLITESASKRPADPEIQFHLGMTHYMLGQEAPARAALQASVQGPKDFVGKAEAVRRLALLAIDPKTADAAAASDLQKQLNETPQDPIALARLGAIQERDGKLDKAADTYQTALKYNPQNSALTFKLAELYSSPSLNDPQKAFALAKTAHDLAPDDPRISAVLGRLAFQSGDHTWAESLLQNSARKLPGDPEVSYDLAWALYSLGRIQEAQTQMQLAAKAGPSFPKSEEANRFLAAVAAASDSSKASQFAPEAQKILSTNPNYVPALMVTAMTQEGQGKYEAAAQSYGQVLARYPLFVPATRNLGLLYFAHLEDDKKAYDLTSKAREAFPQDPDLAKAFGVLTYRKGDYSQASRLLKDCSQTSKADAEVLYYLGMAQYQLKAKTESKVSLQQALALNLQPKLAADAKRILTELK